MRDFASKLRKQELKKHWNVLLWCAFYCWDVVQLFLLRGWVRSTGQYSVFAEIHDISSREEMSFGEEWAIHSINFLVILASICLGDKWWKMVSSEKFTTRTSTSNLVFQERERGRSVKPAKCKLTVYMTVNKQFTYQFTLNVN